MAARRFYLVFCVSLCVLLTWYWITIADPFTFTDLSGQPTGKIEYIKFTSHDLHSQLCTFEAPLDLPEDFGDPCYEPDAAKLFSERLSGYFLCPKTAKEYLGRYPIFNTILNIKPKIVITPFAIPDVQLSLKLARRQNLTVTIRDGGHNPAGYSVSENGLVIDMAYMKSVHFADELTTNGCDHFWLATLPPNSIVAQGGAIWSDVHPLLIERQIEVVGGGCPTVGVVGLALGGGVGWSSRHYGLVSDNMLSVRLVMPNGTVRVVEAEKDPDLMWALRGAGGSNFGVVTDVVLQTQKGYDVYIAGNYYIQASPSYAKELIRIYAEEIIKNDVDSRLTVDLFLTSIIPHDHQETITVDSTIAVFFDGPIDEGLVVLRPFLDRLADAVNLEQVCRHQPLACTTPEAKEKSLAQMRERVRSGRYFLKNETFTSWSKLYGTARSDIYWTSGMVTEWSQELEEKIIDALAPKRYTDLAPKHDGGGFFITVEHLGGAIGKGPSVWKHKDALAMLSIETMTSNYKDDEQERQELLRIMKKWLYTTYATLQQYFTGSYANYADPEMEQWEEKYYGREAYEKLIRIKSQIQDADLFNSEQRIETESTWQTEATNPYWKVKEEILTDSNSAGINALGLDRHRLVSYRTAVCPEWLIQSAFTVDLFDILSLKETPSRRRSPTRPNTKTVATNMLKDRVVFITNATGRIGFAAVLHFLSLGARVLGTSFSNSECLATKSAVKRVFRNFNPKEIGSFECFHFALNELTNVRQLPAILKKKNVLISEGIDVLVLNDREGGSAGETQTLPQIPESVAADYLGQAYLTLLLLQEGMLNLTSGRVIMHSSLLAFKAKEDDLSSLITMQIEDNTKLNHPFPSVAGKEADFLLYSALKAMRISFALELRKRLQSNQKYADLGVFVTLPPWITAAESVYRHNAKTFNLESILRGSTPHDDLTPAEAAIPCVYAAFADLDTLPEPTRVSTSYATRSLLQGAPSTLPDIEDRQTYLPNTKSISTLRYVLGCETGSITDLIKADWMRTNASCQLWKWTIETLDITLHGAVHTRTDNSLLAVENCLSTPVS